MKWWRCEPEFEESLRNAGLDSFDAIMATSAGRLASESDKVAEVRRIEVQHVGSDTTVFVKKSRNEPKSKLLRNLVYAAKPHVCAIREYQLLDRLHKAGFSVMRPIAWGEHTRFGLPESGFLMAKGIRGMDAHELRDHASQDVRCQLQKDFGELTGRLHAAGFFQPVRLKDLICRDADNQSVGPFDLLLIDRATSKPWATRFSRDKGLRAIRRAFRRSSRDGVLLSDAERQAFASGYCDAVAERCEFSTDSVEAMIDDGNRKAAAAAAAKEKNARLAVRTSGDAR